MLCCVSSAGVFTLTTASGQLRVQSFVKPHMESTTEQEPAEKQHQTAGPAVRVSVPLHVRLLSVRLSLFLSVTGRGCWSREWTESWHKLLTQRSITHFVRRWSESSEGFCLPTAAWKRTSPHLRLLVPPQTTSRLQRTSLMLVRSSHRCR